MPVIAASMLLIGASVGAPNANLIEYLLRREEYCAATVDGCIDRDGRQVHSNARYAVGNVACEEAGAQAWRCSYDLKQTFWMEGEQIGEARAERRTGIFEVVSFTARDGKKTIPGLLWTHRSEEQTRKPAE